MHKIIKPAIRHLYTYLFELVWHNNYQPHFILQDFTDENCSAEIEKGEETLPEDKPKIVTDNNISTDTGGQKRKSEEIGQLSNQRETKYVKTLKTSMNNGKMDEDNENSEDSDE